MKSSFKQTFEESNTYILKMWINTIFDEINYINNKNKLKQYSGKVFRKKWYGWVKKIHDLCSPL